MLRLPSPAPSDLPRPRARPPCGCPACAHLPNDERAVAEHSDARAAQLQGRLQPRNEAGILGLVVGVGVSHVLAEAGHLWGWTRSAGSGIYLFVWPARSSCPVWALKGGSSSSSSTTASRV